MATNDRHPICISISKKERILLLVPAESRNKWLQERLDPGVQMLSEITLSILGSAILCVGFNSRAVSPFVAPNTTYRVVLAKKKKKSLPQLYQYKITELSLNNPHWVHVSTPQTRGAAHTN